MDIFETTRIKLSNQGLRIDRYDLNRPWGGFFVLDENQAQAFADLYFEGPVGIVRSATDEEGELVSFGAGETVVLQQGERHRLIGLEGWGIVAEFWQHTDTDHPSDEEDIV